VTTLGQDVEVGFKNLSLKKLFKKPIKPQKSEFSVFKVFFSYCITNSIKKIFKYELGFVSFTWLNICLLDLSLLFIVLVGRNFVSGICMLKPKNLGLKICKKK